VKPTEGSIIHIKYADKLNGLAERKVEWCNEQLKNVLCCVVAMAFYSQTTCLKIVALLRMNYIQCFNSLVSFHIGIVNESAEETCSSD